MPHGAAHDPDLPARPPAAEDPIAAVRFEPRHGDARRHFQSFLHVAGSGVDPPQVAAIIFPRAVPQLAISAERLLPLPWRVAQAIGCVAVAAGIAMIASAVGSD